MVLTGQLGDFGTNQRAKGVNKLIFVGSARSFAGVKQDETNLKQDSYHSYHPFMYSEWFMALGLQHYWSDFIFAGNLLSSNMIKFDDTSTETNDKG